MERSFDLRDGRAYRCGACGPGDGGILHFNPWWSFGAWGTQERCGELWGGGKPSFVPLTDFQQEKPDGGSVDRFTAARPWVA